MCDAAVTVYVSVSASYINFAHFALAFNTQAARRERVEAVSEALRLAANRFYEKKGAAVGSPRRAFAAHPIAYTPL